MISQHHQKNVYLLMFLGKETCVLFEIVHINMFLSSYDSRYESLIDLSYFNLLKSYY